MGSLVSLQQVESNPVVKTSNFSVLRFSDEDVFEPRSISNTSSSGVVLEPKLFYPELKSPDVLDERMSLSSKKFDQNFPWPSLENCVDEVNDLLTFLVVGFLDPSDFKVVVIQQSDELLISWSPKKRRIHSSKQSKR